MSFSNAQFYSSHRKSIHQTIDKHKRPACNTWNGGCLKLAVMLLGGGEEGGSLYYFNEDKYKCIL